MTSIQIRPVAPKDRPWVNRLLTQNWGSTRVVSYGQVHDAAGLPGLAALDGELPVGLATYRIEGSACELVTLNSLRPKLGTGTQLMEAVEAKARKVGCERLWLVTTNDNLKALGFYQKRGFKLIELRYDAMAQSRELKPEIPFVGKNGIPIRDEMVLEKILE
jgi:ribosomal protein S18 acetylase RimI-like enzyme